MTNINDVGRRDPVSLQGIGTSRRDRTGAAGEALATLAGRLTATLAQALNLVPIERQQPWNGGADDAYGVAEVADALTRELGGTPTDAGDLSRALHAFVAEAATLVAARPEGVSVERVQSAILAVPEGRGSVRDTLAAIDAATRAIAAKP